MLPIQMLINCDNEAVINSCLIYHISSEMIFEAVNIACVIAARCSWKVRTLSALSSVVNFSNPFHTSVNPEKDEAAYESEELGAMKT